VKDPFVNLPEAAKPERRRGVRYARNEALCHLARPLPRGSRCGWLLDVSPGGAGLLLTEEVPAGTQLALELAPAVGVLQARVVHSCELGDGAWLVGCLFDHPLADDDLRTLAHI
jgi:PilZ domain